MLKLDFYFSFARHSATDHHITIKGVSALQPEVQTEHNIVVEIVKLCSVKEDGFTQICVEITNGRIYRAADFESSYVHVLRITL